MVYRVLDVARYIINYSNQLEYGISNLKLQKLLYFVQAEFLAFTEKLKRRMKEICNSLNWMADEYAPQKTAVSIRKYMEKQRRILYSETGGKIAAQKRE